MSAITQHQRHTTEWFEAARCADAIQEVPEYLIIQVHPPRPSQAGKRFAKGRSPEDGHRVFGQAIKGVRWMPWHQEAMKDVVTCDKPRLAGSKLTRGSPNRETPPGKPRRSLAEYIGQGSQPGELKHLSTPRKRKQTAIPSVAASESGTAQTACM